MDMDIPQREGVGRKREKRTYRELARTSRKVVLEPEWQLLGPVAGEQSIRLDGKSYYTQDMMPTEEIFNIVLKMIGGMIAFAFMKASLISHGELVVGLR